MRGRCTISEHRCSVESDSVTPWTVAHQAPLSMGFSRQEYWSRLPFPSPGDLLHPGIKPMSPASPASSGRFFFLALRLLGSPSGLQSRKLGRPWWLSGASPADAGDFGLIPGSSSIPGERNGNPLQYACLGNPTDRRSLEGYSSWGCTRVRSDSATKTRTSHRLKSMGGL